MRSIALLTSRLVLGGYMIVHGTQKLFGAFGGHGLEGTGGFFEDIGLAPGKQMAALAGTAELGSGVLTATGIAYPLGPLMVAGTMAVATTIYRSNGALAAQGGFELPLTNLAVASALAAAGPGKLRLGKHLPKPLTTVAGLASAGIAGYAIAQLVGDAAGQPGAAPSPSEASPGAGGSKEVAHSSDAGHGDTSAEVAPGGPSADGSHAAAIAERNAWQR